MGALTRLRRRGGVKRVVLLVVDSVSGLIWPPAVVEGEESEGPWRQVFPGQDRRAGQAGWLGGGAVARGDQ
jgi:hypothetical protein